MNSPPEELSPSPSSPSSSSPPPEEVTTYTTASQIASSSFLSPNQTKRRLPPSSSSHLIAREGRENKSRRKDIEKEDVLRLIRNSPWESRGGDYATSSKAKDDLVDMHVVEYMRKAYGDPLSND